MRLVAICALVLLAAAPASAQDWERFYPEAAELKPEMLTLLLDPTVPRDQEGRYAWVSLRDLLAPVYTFPDAATRYVALKRAASRPTFTAAELAGGTTSSGLLTAAPVPRISQGSEGVWVGVGVPKNRPLTYTAFGSPASLTDRTGTFVPQSGAVTLGGTEYSVWVGNETIAFGLDRRHVFFARGALVPAAGDR